MEKEKALALTDLPRQDTIPTLFWTLVHERGGKVALREKDLGIWRAISWTAFGDAVRKVAMGLVSLDLAPGDMTCILSNNLPEWVYADLGALCAGAVSVGIYPTDSTDQVEYILNDCHAKVLFVEDEEQLDKALAVRDSTPGMRHIVVFDMEGLRGFSDPMVMSFEELCERGQVYDRDHPGVFEQRVVGPNKDDLAVLVYTSGTTGPPKGAMLSHDNIVFSVTECQKFMPFSEDDERLSFLPLCHVAERVIGLYWSLASGAVCNFAESVETVAENVCEVQPTVMLAVPRIWEKFYSAITITMSEATPLARWAYGKAMSLGEQMVAYKLDQRPAPLALRFRYWLASQLVLGNIRRAMGLDRARWLISGAAPISPDLIRWYLALGLDMGEGYGQTESSGFATLMPWDNLKPGTIGQPAPFNDIKISPENEILIRGRNVFMGYYNNSEKTAETIRDGWLHTGDIGSIDNEGFVRITDRMKDIIITAGGKNVTPSEIENQLKFSPYISDAVVIGDRRKYLTCLVMIDHDNVVKFAQDHNVPFTNFASLTRATAVIDLIGQEVEAVNAKFARVETIKQFRLIGQMLDPEDDELTPTMKLKRKFVNEKYGTLIDGMYAGA